MAKATSRTNRIDVLAGVADDTIRENFQILKAEFAATEVQNPHSGPGVEDSLCLEEAYMRGRRRFQRTVAQMREYYFAAGRKQGRTEALDDATGRLQSLT